MPERLQLRPRAERSEERQMCRPSERNHFDRQRHRGAEPVDELAVVRNDDQTGGHAGHHLLPQQRAAVTLDQVQARLDFVCAIYGEIEIWQSSSVDSVTPTS